jgi:hypothetical protein
MMRQSRPDRISQRRVLRLGLGSGTIAALLLGTASLAQQSTDLPPPPSVSLSSSSQDNPVLSPASPQPAVQPPNQPETVFQAPDPPAPDLFPVPQVTPLPTAPQVSLPTRRFTVVVNGDSPYLVRLVQAVEPQARLQKISGRQMIQSGVFATESAAQQRVESLKQQGIQSEVRSEVRSEISRSGSPTDRYLVIVPGSPAELPGLTQQAVRLGVRSAAIQPRDQPLGTHLELGSFVDRAEAEAVSRSLRAGGLDARVYFNR